MNCEKCIHYEICKWYDEPVGKVSDCDFYKPKNKYIEMAYEIDRKDLIAIYDKVAQAMVNLVERMKNENLPM